MDGKDLPQNDKEFFEQDFELEISFTGSVDEVKAQMEICAACGSRLILKHFSDFTNLVMQEKAKCMECGVRVRNALYQMQ